MKIVIDDKIPFIKGVLEPYADVVYVTGKSITNEMLKDVDALIIRTRTCCNRGLLVETPVQFIGTATIGYDHIDTHWCENNGIVWKNAPGCNANSVNQYIASTLFHLSRKFGFSLKDRTLGVVGVGNVGSKVVHTADLLGMKVYLCDPPRERNEGRCGYISLEGIIRECDIITFHVPLIGEGVDKTWHMIDESLLSSVNKGSFIINSSRGEVADTSALKRALCNGSIAGVVLDVWENEPDIDLELMQMAVQATPHIAGYSADGKANGTSMIVRDLSRHFDLGIETWEVEDIPLTVSPELTIDCSGLSDEEVLAKAVLHTYDVSEDDLNLRKMPGNFEKLRGDYPLRREFHAYSLKLSHGDDNIRKICRKMGFNII